MTTPAVVISSIVKDNHFIGYRYKMPLSAKVLVMKLNKAIKLVPITEDLLYMLNIIPEYLGYITAPSAIGLGSVYDILLPAPLYCRNDIKSGQYKEKHPDGKIFDITYINKADSNFVYRDGPFSLEVGDFSITGIYKLGLPIEVKVMFNNGANPVIGGILITYDSMGYKSSILASNTTTRNDAPQEFIPDPRLRPQLFSPESIDEKYLMRGPYLTFPTSRPSDILKIPLKERYKEYMPYCKGITTIPSTFKEFKELDSKMGDYWDKHIACVLWGDKIMALTVYLDEVESGDPYEIVPSLYFDRELHSLAVEYKSGEVVAPGTLQVIKTEDTYFYFKAGDEVNVKVYLHLFKLWDEGIYKKDFTPLRSLLLGYTPISIICLYVGITYAENNGKEISTADDISDKQYHDMVSQTIKKYTPKIQAAADTIRSMGGRYNGDSLVK